MLSDISLMNLHTSNLWQERTMKLAKEQVKLGLTFFMDLEVMKENNLAILVPDALEVRIREIERLGEHPHLYEIYPTYYDFVLLTEGSNRVRDAGVPEDVTDTLLVVLGEMGEVTGVKSKQLKFSPDLIVVLWNMFLSKVPICH
jgi:hypothetical protein